MELLVELIQRYLKKYKRKRESLQNFLKERELESYVHSFDIQNRKISLLCRNAVEKHFLELKKNQFIADFKAKFDIDDISVVLNEEERSLDSFKNRV